MHVYPVQVLDFLLENPDQIPEEWKECCIFFWSPYRNAGGSLRVRYLYWNGETWDCNYYWLGYDWNSLDSAAVPASIEVN